MFWSEYGFQPEPDCKCPPCEARRNRPVDPPQVDRTCKTCGHTEIFNEIYDYIPLHKQKCEEVHKKDLERREHERKIAEANRCKDCNHLPNVSYRQTGFFSV